MSHLQRVLMISWKISNSEHEKETPGKLTNAWKSKRKYWKTI